MTPDIVRLGVGIGAGLLILIGVIGMVARFYQRVQAGQALIINKMNGPTVVTFIGGLVLPIVHRGELLDMSLKLIQLDRRGKEGVVCKDSIRADIKVSFFVKVNQTAEDVLKVAALIGCARASDPHVIEQLFAAKFSEALEVAARGRDFEELCTRRDEFRDEILRVIGSDLNGFVLDDAAIDYLEQTPIEHLNPENIFDAQGIRKLNELMARAGSPGEAAGSHRKDDSSTPDSLVREES